MLGNKMKIIIIILIVMIVVVGIGGTVLYILTDFLKSDETLFQKYIAQNVKNMAYILDISSEENMIDSLRKNDHNESVSMELRYLKNQNDQEEVYKMKEQGIIAPSKEKSYRKLGVAYGHQNLVSMETLKEDNVYGLRLSNLVQQFVSVENATVSYLVSSMGYDGQYFSEKLNGVDISGILNFSDEEIENITQAYTDAIFSEIDKDNYSSKSNVIITLNNGESVTTKAYTLTITQNDLDKIYKRVLNQTINNQVILSKLDEIDAKIKEIGIVEPEGKSLKETFVSKLQKKSDSIEYKGTDERKIIFTVNQKDGTTVRTSIKTEDDEITIDLDETEGKSMSLKEAKVVNDAIDTKVYVLGRTTNQNGSSRKMQYNDAKQNLEVNIKNEQQEQKIESNIDVNYTSDEIAKVNIAADIKLEMAEEQTIPESFNEKNNIIINNYEGEQILAIYNELKERFIASLEKSQSNINTKLLNNILLLIDEKEQESANEEQNNIELQKQRFNNQFVLYEGKNLEYEHVQKLIKVIGKNMSNYQVVNGNRIKIFIDRNSTNEASASEISNVITDEHTYNVEINYSEEGWVQTIDISIYEEED